MKSSILKRSKNKGYQKFLKVSMISPKFCSFLTLIVGTRKYNLLIQHHVFETMLRQGVNNITGDIYLEESK